MDTMTPPPPMTPAEIANTAQQAGLFLLSHELIDEEAYDKLQFKVNEYAVKYMLVNQKEQDEAKGNVTDITEVLDAQLKK